MAQSLLYRGSILWLGARAFRVDGFDQLRKFLLLCNSGDLFKDLPDARRTAKLSSRDSPTGDPPTDHRKLQPNSKGGPSDTMLSMRSPSVTSQNDGPRFHIDGSHLCTSTPSPRRHQVRDGGDFLDEAEQLFTREGANAQALSQERPTVGYARLATLISAWLLARCLQVVYVA